MYVHTQAHSKGDKSASQQQLFQFILYGKQICFSLSAYIHVIWEYVKLC